MRRYLTLAIVLLYPSLSIGAEGSYTKAELDKERLAIIRPDEYKLDELPKIMGSGWLALVSSPDGKWSLVPTTARRKKCSVCELSDLKVTSSQPNALFLLRHQSLRPGQIRTPELKFEEGYAGAFLFKDTAPVKFSFNGKDYQFSWGNKVSKITTLEDGEKREDGLRNVILAYGNRKQIIGSRPLSNDEGTHMLAWAGDLDNDGLLDFIIEDGFNNGSLTCLYLSSVAGKGKFIRRVSCYGTSGC